jgi:hypothetical protein
MNTISNEFYPELQNKEKTLSSYTNEEIEL